MNGGGAGAGLARRREVVMSGYRYTGRDPPDRPMTTLTQTELYTTAAVVARGTSQPNQSFA